MIQMSADLFVASMCTYILGPGHVEAKSAPAVFFSWAILRWSLHVFCHKDATLFLTGELLV